MNLFALADRKRVLVSDLMGLTLDEVQDYIAFYEIKTEIEMEALAENARRKNINA